MKRTKQIVEPRYETTLMIRIAGTDHIVSTEQGRIGIEIFNYDSSPFGVRPATRRISPPR